MIFRKEKCKRKLKVKLAYSAIKIVVKMHFKDEKEAAQQKVTVIMEYAKKLRTYMF